MMKFFKNYFCIINYTVSECFKIMLHERKQVHTDTYKDAVKGPLLLTWFNFNPSMDK